MAQILFACPLPRCRNSPIRLSQLAPRRENYRAAVAAKRRQAYSYRVAQSRCPFTPRTLMYAPRVAGTYTLWNGDVLICAAEVVAPGTILDRLMDHYCGRAKPSQATHCGWHACAEAELDAAGYERT
jgi:hypothetical protein